MRAIPAPFVLLLVLTLGSSIRATAASIVWNNTAGGNWNVATNWTPNVIPGAADLVYITNAGSYIVTLNASASVAGLTLGGPSGTQRLTNNTLANILTLTGASYVGTNGVLGQGNGTLNGTGALTIDGRLYWGGGTFSDGRTLTITPLGLLTVSGTGAKTFSGPTLVNAGRITWTTTVGFSFNIGTLTNTPTGVIDIQSNGTISDGDGPGTPSTILNAGTLQKTVLVGTTTFSGATVDNTGTISVQSGTLTFSESLSNHGICRAQTGILTLSGGGTHSGQFDALASGEIRFSGGAHTLEAGAEFTGPGLSSLAAAGASLTLAGGITAANFGMTAGTLTGPGEFKIMETFNWTGGTWSGAGTVKVEPAATLTLDGVAGKTLNGRTLQIAGAAVWKGAGALGFSQGIIDVATNGLFDIQNGTTFSDTDGAATVATLNNAGTVRKSVGTATTPVNGISFNNAGTVDIQSGTLVLNAAGSHSGRFISGGAQSHFTFGGGNHALQAGASFTGPGLHHVTGSTTTLTLSGSVGCDVFEFANGTMTGPGNLTATNLLRWQGGTWGGTGTNLVLPGATLELNGSLTCTLNGRTVVNRGTARWTGTGGINLNSGTFLNDTGAQFEIQNDEVLNDGDGSATPASFVNAGTVRKSVTTGVTDMDGAEFNNLGSVEINSGTLNLGDGGSSGAFQTAIPAAVIQFTAGAHTLLQGASLSGPGILRLSGSGTSLTIDGSVATPSFEILSGTLNGPGSLIISNAFTWSGGTLGGQGVTRVLPPAAFTLSGTASKILAGRTLINGGTAVWTGTGQLNLNGGILRNGTNGTFTIQNDALINDNDGAATVATIENNGIFRKSVATGTTSVNGPSFNNNGTLELQSGSLTLGSGASAGSFDTVAPNSTLTFGAGTHTLAAGARFVGAGTNRLNGFNAVLAVTGNVSADRFTQVSGTLGGAGTLTVTNALTWLGGSQSGSGLTRLLPGSTLLISGTTTKTFDGRTLENAGTATWAGSGSIDLSRGTFNNLPGAVLDCQIDNAINDIDGPSTPGVFNNQGTFRKTAASGQTTLSGIIFNNPGTFDVQSGTVNCSGDFNNTGLCRLSGGNLNLGGSGSSSGQFDATAPGFRVNFEFGTNTLTAGTTLTGSGTNRITFGTVVISGVVTARNLEQVGGTVTGPGLLDITGRFLWGGGEQTGSGITSIAQGASLVFSSPYSPYLTGRTISNAGAAVWNLPQSGFFAFSSGTFDNLAGATFDLESDINLQDNDGPGTPALFNNAGTFRKTSPSANPTLGQIVFRNSGLFDLQTGSLRFLGEFQNLGNAMVRTNLLTLEGGGSATGSFSIENGGLLEFEGGTFRLDPGAAFPGPGLVRLDGTLDVAADTTIGRLLINSGNLIGAATLNVTNRLSWNGGTMAGSGITRIPAAATLEMTNAFGAVLAGRTIDNLGTFVVPAAAIAGSLQMNSGVISNRAGALLDIQSPGTYFDFDGPATLSRIENAGTLRLRPSTGFAQFNGVAFRNTGAFTVESGGASLGSFLQTAGSATVASVTFNADWIDLQGGVFSGSATILTTNFINGATLNPGASPGFITLNGPYQQTAAGTLNIELGGVLSGSQYDVLNIASTATLAGTLNISLLSGYQPALGAIFIPLSYTQRSGTFSTVTGTAVGNGVALDLDYEPTALVLQAESSTNTSTIQFAAGTPLPDGSMIITLTGTAGLTFTIESSTNFLSWTPVVGVTNAGLTYSFVLTNLTSRPYEFFRTRQ